MNKDNYFDIIEGIDNALGYYEDKGLENTKFSLNFSNGEFIYLKYGINNIAHLLGINTNYLMSTGIFKGNSYDILCDIVDNPGKLMRQIENGHIHESQIFSDYTEEKLENFRRICGVNIFDIEFIVEYKKDRNLTSSEPLDDGYYIGYSDGQTLNIVGYEKNDNNNTYYPHTSLLFKKDTAEADKFLKRLFKNQVATTVETMKKNLITHDYGVDRKVFYYNHRDKISKLRSCKRYAEMYGGIPNTINSNIYFIDKTINANEDNYSFKEIMEEISKKISDKKMIDVHQLEAKYDYMDDTIINIVSAHNDSLVKKSEGNDFSYKDIITELEECKKELERKNSFIEKIEDENNQIKAENELLRLENESLNKDQEQVIKILTKNRK